MLFKKFSELILVDLVLSSFKTCVLKDKIAFSFILMNFDISTITSGLKSFHC